MKTLIKNGVVAIFICLFSSSEFAQTPDQAKVIAAADKVIEQAAKSSPASAPGCAVGVSLSGKSVFEKAFGMAEIEHGVPNTAQTIFESGSVAKQFTAASIVLLSLEGKLGLVDPVRKYIPELPDYGAALTIRHLLNHTGGVRDWGSVMELTGYGRGDRVISQDLAMDVITHQKGLDFTPGAEYSYSNSGYTLLSTIVERVSKQKLPAFTEERFFKPLGMTHTSWRDDYRRLVPGRAQAYSQLGNLPFRLEMPFMNVYGNGGMLTTVGDWLKWNEMLDSRSMGAPLVEAFETTGVLNDGRKITYALGLVVSQYRGQREVSHNGSTAGYQTYLGRFPGLKLSVAVLCNGPTKNATVLGHAIVDELVAPLAALPQPEAIDAKADELQKIAGLWRNDKTHLPMRTVIENGVLRVSGGAVLRPLKDGSFQGGQGAARWKFETATDGKPTRAIQTIGDDVNRFIFDPEWTPTPAELQAFAGTWHSDEADATFSVVVEGSQVFLVQRPTTRIPLRAQYKDHFMAGQGQIMWFTREGKSIKLHVGTSRMRDMPFERAGN